MTKLSLKILPQRRKSNGKLNIYVCLTHKKEVRYITTEFEIDDEFQFENGKVCYCKNASILNKRLDFVLTSYQDKLSKLNTSKFATCAQLKEALLENVHKPEELMTISNMFQNRILRLNNENRKSYADMNRYTCKVIISIIKDIPVECLTRNDIKTLFNGMKRLGFSNGNIQMRMTHLKAAINELIDEHIISFEEHPFKGFKMPQSEIRMMDITQKEFKRIEELKTSEKQLYIARDLFLISFYLGGINLVDLVKADFSSNKLTYVRTKSAQHKIGEKKTVITIQPEAREIINRYIGSNGKLNLGTSTYMNFRRHLNKCFKLLAEQVGISNVSFSFYSARKTFAQFAFELGIRTEVIEYCIGQSMKANRPIYNYVRVMQRYADDAIRKVIDYALGNPNGSNAINF